MNAALEIYNSITSEEFIQFSKEGWAVMSVDNKSIEVQKIDDVEDWKYANDFDFDIPQLQSDDEAVKLASKYFVLDGYKIVEKIKTPNSPQ